MSKYLVVAMCCLMSLMTLGTAYGFDPAKDPALIAWWACDDGEGTVVTDVSGNGHDGTAEAGAVWVQGMHDGAISLPNVLVEIPAINMSLTEATMSAWVKPNGSQPDWSAIIFTRGSATGFNVNGLVLRYHWGDAAATYNYVSNVNILDGEWNFVALTVASDKAVFYLDGVESATNTVAHGTVNWNANIYLGGDGGGTFPARRFSDAALDDVSLYSRALAADEILLLMRGLADPTLAGNPSPGNGTGDVQRDGTQLVWKSSENAATHNVYFGTDMDEVTNATVPTSAGQDANSFDPGRLEFGETYYWRVDEVNGAPDYTVFKGETWSFMVEPYSIMIPVDVNNVTASSYVLKNPPSMTVNGSGLTDDTHSINGETMWLSASPDAAPWLMFEFNSVQKLDKMLIWNSNSSSEAFIGWGIKDVTIEHSIDGVDWTVLSDATQISRAPGLPTYNELQAIDFSLAQAKYVRINILNNWGGLLKQYGVAEVQFYGLPVQARTPVPATDAVNVRPDSMAQWRAGREADQHTVYVSTDPNAVADGSAASVSSMVNSVDLASFDLQLDTAYSWKVDEVNDAEAPSVWAGDVWSFSTSAVLTVDDFESYTNFSPDRPFQTWIDGYGFSLPEPGNPGNATGAAVGHDIWSPASPQFEGDIMETTFVHGGGKAMPIYYDNSGSGGKATYSQVDRVFAKPQNWSGYGIQTLVVYFFGDPGNAGQLYVKVNNAKITYDGDPTDIKKAQWLPWPITLSNVNTNLKSVTSFHIGVDGAGAKGVILVDDIILTPNPVEYVTPVQPADTGWILHYTFDAGAGTSVVDSSGNGNTGTYNVVPTWTTGVSGSAISLNGVSSYVGTGKSLLNNLGQFTIACWLKGDLSTAARSGIIGQNDCIEYAAVSANRIEIWTPGGGSLQFDWPYGIEDGWHQITAVGDGTSLSLYLDGRVVAMGGSALAEGATYGTSTYFLNIGGGGISDATDNWLAADIDDARVYNRALSAEEVAGLAGLTTQIYKAQ